MAPVEHIALKSPRPQVDGQGMDISAEPLRLDDRARRALATSLDVLARRSDLPLRVRDHHAHAAYDVFEITEEPEGGGGATRYVVSAGPDAAGLVILGGGR